MQTEAKIRTITQVSILVMVCIGCVKVSVDVSVMASCLCCCSISCIISIRCIVCSSDCIYPSSSNCIGIDEGIDGICTGFGGIVAIVGEISVGIVGVDGIAGIGTGSDSVGAVVGEVDAGTVDVGVGADIGVNDVVGDLYDYDDESCHVF